MTKRKKNTWIYLVIMLSVLSIFSQLNSIIDVIISIAFFGTAITLFNKDEFVLIYAVLYVFMGRLYLYPEGVSLINVFLLLYAARMILRKEPLYVQGLLFPILIILSLYGFLVIFPTLEFNILILINYFTSILLLFSLLHKLKNIELLKKFLFSLSISSIAGCIYGIVNVNSYSYSETLTTATLATDRFKGATSDPNYMAIVLLIGLLGLFVFETKQNRVLLTASSSVLVYSILLTRSTTALICLTLILGLYLSMRKIGMKFVIVSLLGIMSLVLITYNFDGIQDHLLQTQTYDSLFSRSSGQFADILKGNEDDIASGRLIIAKAYWNYYWDQDIFKILIGGNLCGIFGVDQNVLASIPTRAATHNTQLDVLLATGLIGWLCFSIMAIWSMIMTRKMFYTNNERIYKILFIIKFIIIVFTFSLSFFPGWTIYIFYLLDLTTNKQLLGCDQNENPYNCT